MDEIARVEALIRAGVERAKAAGKRIERGHWGTYCDGNGYRYRSGPNCCLLAPMVVGNDGRGAFEIAAHVLGIEMRQAQSIAWGFDEQDDVLPVYIDRAFSALGARLGREFVDGVK